MFSYKNKDYGSKADVVRELYDNGVITLSAPDKKKIAEELGMTVQTVHATIMKHIGLKTNAPKTAKEKKIAPAVVQANSRLNQKLAKVRSTDKAIFINDKSDEVREELMKDDKKIAILSAPNQWGLPICNPPLYVIDPNYDPNWNPEPDDKVERNWE